MTTRTTQTARSFTNWFTEADVSEGFRAMMRGFPSGVSIVTALDADGRPWGLTCSSLCSVALTPPTIVVCLRAASPTLSALLTRDAFSVNFLHEDSRGVAEVFASGDPNRFDRITWELDEEAAGPHLRRDTHAVADCTAVKTVPVGAHVAVFGEVYRVSRTRGDCRPLLYGLRSFGRWRGWGT